MAINEEMPIVPGNIDEATMPTEAVENRQPADPPLVGMAPESQNDKAAAPAEAGEQQQPAAYPVVEAIAVNKDDEAEMQLALKNLEERRKRKRRSRIIKIVVACALVAAAIVAWMVFNAMNAKPEAEEPSLADLSAALQGSAPQGIQATGTLKPGSSAVVTPEVSGIIEEVRVVEGQQVHAGDILFTIKSAEAEKDLADARTAVDRAQNGVSRAQSDVSSAQLAYDDAINAFNAAVDSYNSSIGAATAAANTAYDRAYQQAVAAIPSSASAAERARLIEEAKVTAQTAYDETYQQTVGTDPGTFDHSAYTSAIDAANNQVATANEALEDAQRTYAQAQERADKRLVKSPRSGTVLSCKAVVGETVGSASGGTSSSTDPSVLIGDLSSMEVDIEVNEIDVAGVKVGQQADVTFPAFAGLQEKAQVVSVAAAATNSSSESGGAAGIVTFTVKLVIKHPDERLKAGMSANVSIEAEGETTAASSASAATATSSASAASSGSAS